MAISSREYLMNESQSDDSSSDPKTDSRFDNSAENHESVYAANDTTSKDPFEDIGQLDTGFMSFLDLASAEYHAPSQDYYIFGSEYDRSNNTSVLGESLGLAESTARFGLDVSGLSSNRLGLLADAVNLLLLPRDINQQSQNLDKLLLDPSPTTQMEAVKQGLDYACVAVAAAGITLTIAAGPTAPFMAGGTMLLLDSFCLSLTMIDLLTAIQGDTKAHP